LQETVKGVVRDGMSLPSQPNRAKTSLAIIVKNLKEHKAAFIKLDSRLLGGYNGK